MNKPISRWDLRHRLRHRPVLRAAAILIAIVVLFVLGVYGWARTATDTSQVARAIVWGDSGFGDQHLFPSRKLAAATDPVVFGTSAGPAIGDYVGDGQDLPLEQLLEETGTTAFIVLHRNELLYEQYFNGSSRNSMQTSFSVAKSFVATLVGIAIDEGLVDGLDDPVTRYVPELAERDHRFEEITLIHLITMSSGLSFDDGSSPWADPAATYYGTDLRRAVIDKPEIEAPPGVEFRYNDWNVILLGLVLERAAGMPVTEFAQTRLWQPMGAEADGSWSLDSERGGFEKMFVGVNGRAIDLAKLGWLYLNGGRNGDRQIVSADFVAAATSADIATDPALDYQFLWWIDSERTSYYANGDHGQYIYVDPEGQFVIARNGFSAGGLDWVTYSGDLADWLQEQLNDSPSGDG